MRCDESHEESKAELVLVRLKKRTPTPKLLRFKSFFLIGFFIKINSKIDFFGNALNLSNVGILIGRSQNTGSRDYELPMVGIIRCDITNNHKGTCLKLSRTT